MFCFTSATMFDMVYYISGSLTLSAERQSAWMSKITNDGLRCFIAVAIWQQWASKG